MTYLELVNNVLLRLRESTVASVSTSQYSQIIGEYVNDAKRQVEDAWNWEALDTTIPVITTPGTSTVTVVGSGIRQKGVTVNNTTNQNTLFNVPNKWIQHQQQLAQVQSGPPVYYAWTGNDGTDSKLELYPTPDGVYTLMVNLTVPQVKLTADADVLLIPSEAVIAGAFARALVERGEDGGLSSSEAYGLYKGILADQIAVESSRSIENECWVAT